MTRFSSLALSVRLILLGALGASALRAQLERPVPYPLPRTAAWDRAVEAGTRTDDGVPGAAYWTNRARYSIDAEIDPSTAMVEGAIEMVYENRSPRALDRLVVHLRHNAHKEGNLRNRFLEITGGVELGEVTVDDVLLPEGKGNRRSAGTRLRGTVLTLWLPEKLEPGASATVKTSWRYRVPKRGAPRNGHDGHHTYWLGYWYPQFAVLEDVDGWVADQYMTNAEFYMGYADYDLRLTAPQGWMVQATGALQNPKDVLTDAAQERLAAARDGREIVHVVTAEDLEAGQQTRPSPTGKHTWHFKAESVRDMAVSVCDRYLWDATHAVVQDREGAGQDGVAMIHALYREDQARSFRSAAEYARHTIEYMSKLVHPYLWPHMTVCGGVIGGGMEFPMMTICGSGGRGLVAHELIHMWFPMLVGTNEKARAWQDEGFTTFFTSLTTAAFDDKPNNPRRDVGGYLRVAAMGESAPLMRHGDAYAEAGNRGAYGFASYSKSASILHQLRSMLGDDVFLATFRKYARDWAFKHPRAEDFFNAFSAGAERDLNWYFRTWYHDTWTLDQAVADVSEADGKTIVTVEDRGYATYPTIVRATYDDGSVAMQEVDLLHWLSGYKTAKVEFEGTGVTKVEINPDRVTLDLSRRNNEWRREGDR